MHYETGFSKPEEYGFDERRMRQADAKDRRACDRRGWTARERDPRTGCPAGMRTQSGRTLDL